MTGTLRALAALVALVVLAACTGSPAADPSRVPSQTPSSSAASPTAPGSVPAYLLNPAVTQASIASTVCVAGWTDTVRPPSSYTTALKVRQLAARGAVNPDLSAYEEDHLVPLGLGGAPRDERNLWPEPIDQARIKDLDESRLHRDVCAVPPRATLEAARLEMYVKWVRWAVSS